MPSNSQVFPRSLIIAIFTSLVAGMALSQAASAHNVNAHQAELSDLIEHGRKAGSITFSEGRSLRKELRQIELVEAKLRSNDGHLDRSERRVLHRLLRSAERIIKTELYDAQRRPKLLPRVGK
ncbi:MAG: hypothetical protein AAFV69_00580 [Pseudomonadota bacterium]